MRELAEIGSIEKNKCGRPALDMVGMKFSRLSVIERVPSRRSDQATWKCQCDCGKIIETIGSRLRGGTQKSCGCFRRDRTGNLYKTHGKSQTVEYCMFYDARKRAIKLGLPFSIAPEDIVIPTNCPVLGIPLMAEGPRDSRPSLDRIIPLRGYTPANICVISFRANRIKSDANADELRAVLSYVVASCVS